MLELIFFIIRGHGIILNNKKAIRKTMKVTTLFKSKRKSHKNQQAILSSTLDGSQVLKQSCHPQDPEGPDKGPTVRLARDGCAGREGGEEGRGGAMALKG